jgi:hypothetical protein
VGWAPGGAPTPVPPAVRLVEWQQVTAEEEGQPFGIDPVILEPGRGDGFRLLGVRQDGVVPQAFHQIHEPPPRPRRLNGDSSPPGQLGQDCSSRFGSFASCCCVTSPAGINTASCELGLCKSTPTCTIASVSFRRVG